MSSTHDVIGKPNAQVVPCDLQVKHVYYNITSLKSNWYSITNTTLKPIQICKLSFYSIPRLVMSQTIDENQFGPCKLLYWYYHNILRMPS